MNLAEFSVKNSLFVNMISVFVIIAGLFSLMKLQNEAFPNVTFDVIQISASYPGATADQVERFVTSPIEKEIRGITGIDEINSVSYDGSSSISIKLDPDVKKTDKVENDIQDAVDRVKDLPKDMDKPRVYAIEMKEYPVIHVELSGGLPEARLQEYAEGLEDQILEIKGVSKVRRGGFRDKQIWVEVDPEMLKDYYISMEEVMDALGKQNVTIPAGKLRTGTNEYNIQTQAEFYTAEEIAEVVVRANDAGNIVRVKDIARVRDDFEDENNINKANGTRAISLIVVKKEKADAIAIVSDVRRTVQEFKKNAVPQLHTSFVQDLSYYIKRRLNVLRWNGICGFILVVGVLFLFLAPASATFTALGLPVAFLATFAMMLYFGMSINLITMFGLIMVLGMIVDDSIIIAENVHRYAEEGMSPKEAAIKGTSEVMLPVLSTVLTTIAAFTPLMFMPGLLGKFVKFIPQVVIIALVASLLEAFIILPSHLADFVRPIKKGGLKNDERRWFAALKAIYSSLLNRALNHRYLVMLGTMAVFLVSIFIAIKFIPVVLFTSRGIEQFMIRAEAPFGTSLYKTNEMIEPVERLVGEISDKELDAFITNVGKIEEDRGYDPDAKKGSRYAQITVFLTPAQQRKRSAEEIAASLNPKLKELNESIGFERLHTSTMKEGPPVGKPVEIKVRGEKFEALNEISSKIMHFMGDMPGVYDLASDYNFGKLELIIDVDEEKCKEAGLDISSVATSVRNAFKGGVATKIKRPKAEKEIEVLVRFPEEQRNNMESFKELLIPNINGKLIPLSKVATINSGKDVSDICHLDGKRAITISAQVDNRITTPLKVANALRREFKDIPHQYMGYTLNFGGEQKETYSSLFSLLKAFILAFLLIFIILTTQFRSLVQPFVVMLAIPFGIIGVIIAFLIHREIFTFVAIMGMIGLGGVVVNDSIVLMDFINKLRLEGTSRRESILQSGVLRLRPVLLTTITTVFGLLPCVYGIGGFDPFVRPMALAISWGLLFATVLTLIVIPCAYAIVDDMALKLFHRPSIIARNNK